MRKVDKQRVELSDLSEDQKLKADEADAVKGGMSASSKKKSSFFDEADALFGRNGRKKRTP